MRKTFCTASIFIAFIVIIAASVLIKVPSDGWPLYFSVGAVPLCLWLVGAGWWALAMCAVFGAIYWAWALASLCCAKLGIYIHESL